MNDCHLIDFSVGENVDCRDTVNKWMNAEVVGIRDIPVRSIRVHYSGWEAKFDEWIDVNSDRILKQWLRRNSKTKDSSSNKISLSTLPPAINNRIDVFHRRTKQWLEGIVRDIIYQTQTTLIKIHFVGYSSKNDETLNLSDEDLIQTVGRHSRAFGEGKRHVEAL